MRGRKCSLLDLCEVIFRVFVERQLSEAAEREFLLRPCFGEVEDTVLEFLGLLGRHDLYVDGPRGKLLALNGVKEVFGCMIWVRRGECGRLFVVKCLRALVSLEVNLYIAEGAIGLGEFVGVTRVAVHVTV